MIQRYYIDGEDDWHSYKAEKCDGGEWVKFSDLKKFAEQVNLYATMGTDKNDTKLFQVCMSVARLTQEPVYFAEGPEEAEE